LVVGAKKQVQALFLQGQKGARPCFFWIFRTAVHENEKGTVTKINEKKKVESRRFMC